MDKEIVYVLSHMFQNSMGIDYKILGVYKSSQEANAQFMKAEHDIKRSCKDLFTNNNITYYDDPLCTLFVCEHIMRVETVRVVPHARNSRRI